MLRSEFPEVSLRVNDRALGSVACRDLMMRTAKEELVLSLDDDSHPLQPDFLAHVPRLFERHPQAAVLAFPILEQASAPDPQLPGAMVGTFGNGAAAFRRSVYLRSAGFPDFFFHSHEESDYAAQIHGLGYGVWREPALSILHRVSPINRDRLKTDWLNARNEFWSVCLRCPLPWLPVVALFRLGRQFQHACRMGLPWIRRQPHLWLTALRGLPTCLRQRKPIAWPQYLNWMKLSQNPISNPNQWQHLFGKCASEKARYAEVKRVKSEK
jgi:GT2 family glycosyltransferase